MAYTEEVLLQGHVIDSLTLPRVLDAVMDAGGDYAILELAIGKTKDDTSRVRLRVIAEGEPQLAEIMRQVTSLGGELLSRGDVSTAPAPKDGVLPDGFYSTTNYPTEVKLAGEWVGVTDIEMDVAVIVDRDARTARALPMLAVRRGDPVAVGHEGVRVRPPERARGPDLSFSFMSSQVSSEKPKKLAIEAVAREMRAVKARGQRVVVVGGPAIVHTGAAPYLATLIREGMVDVLLGGNAIAVHDVEAALYGTSLGVSLATASPVEGGHHHHMRAINAIRGAGSLREAVASGLLREGIMAEAIRKGIDVVLAGSIRDDGPLPDVITDVVAAQQKMREAVRGAGICLMICTMLHSIATGNMLPAAVRTVVVDINPATVTKLADRGSWQAIGLVTDAELFLRELVAALDLPMPLTGGQRA
jgi:lysine-ketoglutarate reductase/saccharopine dehydrogenase-like protein (TIGR00300 family)